MASILKKIFRSQQPSNNSDQQQQRNTQKADSNIDENITIPNSEVNYIWINRTNDQEFRQQNPDIHCSIYLHPFANALNQAKTNPQNDYNLWIDMEGIDARTNFWLHSYLYYAEIPDNLNIKNLQDLDTYERLKPASSLNWLQKVVFAKKSAEKINTRHVYATADITRFLVLQERLLKSDKQFVIYADLDTDGPTQISAAAKDILSQHGLIFGIMPNKELDHGYVAVDGNHGEAVSLVDSIIFNTKDEIHQCIKNGSNYNQVEEALRLKLDESAPEFLAQKQMSEVGYIPPEDPNLVDTNICLSKLSR